MAVGLASENSRTGMDEANDFLYTRTSWVNAAAAYEHVLKRKATGRTSSLWIRKKIQSHLTVLGDFLHRNSGKVIFVALLAVATFCVGFKSSTLVTSIEKLWVEVDGRLEKELEYVTNTLGEGAGTTNQILIQTSKQKESGNLLNAPSLLTHLEILKAATSVTVDIFDTSWRLHDLCFASNFPVFGNHLIEQIFEKLTPCMIITPLDCFWEGSILIDPEYPVRIPGFGERKWSNLNPQAVLEKMESVTRANYMFPSKTFRQFMKRAGITTAYQQKPCLNPQNPHCPDTSPNKNSPEGSFYFETLFVTFEGPLITDTKQLNDVTSGYLPDIGAELTGGCYGFASKYLHWPEDLIVGGVQKNKTQHIVRAEALQSVVQLMGEKDLYEYWLDHYKVHNMNWSREKANQILDAWVHKFSKKVEEETKLRQSESKSMSLHPFSSAALKDLLHNISQISIARISIGYVILAIYSCMVALRASNKCQSSVGLALTGVIILSGSVASGLGICSLLGLSMNAATTQVLPFLTLSLGLNHMFLLIHTVNEVGLFQPKKHSPVAEVLRRSGMSVIVESLCTAITFFCASVIPIPALRVLCLQAGIVNLVMLAAMIFVFPAFIALDISRRRSGRVDIVCCYSANSDKEQPVKNAKEGKVVQTFRPETTQERWVGLQSIECGGALKPQKNTGFKKSITDRIFGCGFCDFVADVYCRWITQSRFKGLVLVLYFIVIGVSVWSSLHIKYGLDMTDIVPRGTSESRFLDAQDKYFGFYNMFAVTEGNLEYPSKQELIHEYHESFNLIPWIIKNDDGGLPESWLSLFRSWLINLQKAFDADFNKGLVYEDGWNKNASHDSILAYKLLVQTGHVDHPVDKTLVSQIRLVDERGIINPKAFYNYLTAWASNDPFTYGASQADIRPVPRFWAHDPSDYDLKIPKSSPIVYAQLPFYLSGLDDTTIITTMINQVRSICRKYKEQGLPNFPTGVPFTFWEQYTNLSWSFFLILGITLLVVCIIISGFLANIAVGFIMAIMNVGLIAQIGGVISLLGLKMSAVPASLLTISVAYNTQFCYNTLVGFHSFNGNRNHRIKMALQYCSKPVIQGAGAMILATLPLLFSEFDFIKDYFFSILAAVITIGFMNGLIVLPCLLSWVGPAADLVPLHNPNRAPPPSPTNHSPDLVRRDKSTSGGTRHSSRNLRILNPHGSNLSLTTITEEPVSGASMESRKTYQPTEILVEPKVIVETSCPKNSSPKDSFVYSDGHVTTVTATAKVKVELHKPHPISYPECHQYHNKCQSDDTGRISNNIINHSCSCGKQYPDKR